MDSLFLPPRSVTKKDNKDTLSLRAFLWLGHLLTSQALQNRHYWRGSWVLPLFPALCSEDRKLSNLVAAKNSCLIMRLVNNLSLFMGFSGGSVYKESACNAGDTGDVGLIAGLGRSPGGGHDNPFQCSCLKNPRDRAWRATVHRVTKSWTWLKWLSMHTFGGVVLLLSTHIKHFGSLKC